MRKFAFIVEKLQLLPCEKMKFRNVWPRHTVDKDSCRGSVDNVEKCCCRGYVDHVEKSCRCTINGEYVDQWCGC